MLQNQTGHRPDHTTVRCVTLNLWGLTEPLAARLRLAGRGLGQLAPDVVGLQEVRPLPVEQGAASSAHADTDADIPPVLRGDTTADWLAERLGMSCLYQEAVRYRQKQRKQRAISQTREREVGEGTNAPLAHEVYIEGLAILSRHPIREHRVTRLPDARPDEARILLSAYVGAPAAPFWFHTTHLHYRLDDGIARERQVVAIDETVRAIATAEPAGTVQIICGDFNATPEHDEVRFLRGLTSLAGRRTHYQDAFARVHPQADRMGEGLTWSAEPAPARFRRSIDIDRRIDYIFVTARRKDGRGTIVDAAVVLEERDAAAGNIAASDHYGVMAEVQIASDQSPVHMAPASSSSNQ